MPFSDYANAVGGGLKLKGAKDAGVRKHKKKSKSDPSKATKEAEKAIKDGDGEESTQESAVQKALAEEEQEQDAAGQEEKEFEAKSFGKTEAQRRHEERRRKRVSHRHMLSIRRKRVTDSVHSWMIV